MLIKQWGRAHALALMAIGFGTVVESVALALFWMAPEPRDWSVLASVVGAYMVMLAAVGAGAQVPNAAERLPGTRTYSQGSPGRFESRLPPHGGEE